MITRTRAERRADTLDVGGVSAGARKRIDDARVG
jgi:hypothetical protein